MSKRTRINLTVLVTLILVLAAALPALAKKPSGDYTCRVTTPVYNDNVWVFSVWTEGVLDAYWEGGVLYNFCTGTIPLGEEYNAGLHYATFEEVCDYWGDNATCTKGVLSITPETSGGTVEIFDPDTGAKYETDNFYASMNRSGKFLYYKEYTP